MAKTESHIPKLRFAGFSDSWQQKQLSCFSSQTLGGGTPSTTMDDYWNGNIPWIQSSDLEIDRVNGVTPRKFITDNAVKNSATKIVPEDSIAIVTRVGVGKLALIPFSFATSQDFLSLVNLNFEKNYTVYILYKFLQREKDQTQGTSIKGITKADLLDKKIYVSEIREEQTKIGDFFQKIDQVIELQQKALETAQNYKKSMLQKMFPQKGEKAPKVRFDGFSGDWEEKKLEEIGSVKMCKRIFKEQTSDQGDVPFYKIGTFGQLPDSFISTEIYEDYKSKYPYPVIGDLLISASGTIGRIVIYNGEKAYYQDSNIIWLQHSEQIMLNIFFAQLLQQTNWDNVLEGSTIKRLYNNMLLNKLYFFPEIEEQRKIGIFFQKLDQQIAQHEKKLESYQSLKKAMLQRMFV